MLNTIGVQEARFWSSGARLVFGLMSIDRSVTSSLKLETVKNLMVSLFKTTPFRVTSYSCGQINCSWFLGSWFTNDRLSCMVCLLFRQMLQLQSLSSRLNLRSALKDNLPVQTESVSTETSSVMARLIVMMPLTSLIVIPKTTLMLLDDVI